MQKYEIDTSKKINNYENNLNSLNRENMELKRSYADIENKAALLSQEIERLTNNLREYQLRGGKAEEEVLRLQRFVKES